MSSTLKECSKEDFTASQQPTFTDIKTGALQRIADAVEKMALRHTELINARDRYERWYKESQEINRRLANSNAALRGHLKRMKARKE